MSVYLSTTATTELTAAQAMLDDHAVSCVDGRCLRCDVDGPCERRRTALRVFGRYGCLPRRWPGATRPDLLGARRVL